ncbi:hypothetical protein [Vibrio hyugaensis]|uniref:hypothetical protein n=1 Tax=Vibrio hyugaensis TaxID=1534743 RepID=UPI0005EF2D6C|nr:hypothetical protein [Vibrio hyugaensis]
MKSRDLNTIHDLIVSNYRIEAIGGGKFLHSFTPATTPTVYKFIANGAPEVEEGQRYNIGYFVDEEDNRIVDLSALSKNTEVNPIISLLFAKEESKGKHAINKGKNDERVKHDVEDGYYWGKKYAWREYGLVVPKQVFYDYLKEIEHPHIECETINPDLPFTANEKSIAYLDDGLAEAIEALIDSAEKVTKTLYKSPLFSRRFTIRGIAAITDKK